MKRFQRGELLYPFANTRNYVSGAASGFPTKISPSSLQAEGFKPDSELPAEFLNYFIAMAANHANADLDSWFHSWEQMDTGKDSVIGCRIGGGTTICNTVAEGINNTIKAYTDVTAGTSTSPIAPAAGNFSGTACVMAWDNFILVAGANAVAPTKAIWRSVSPTPVNLVELTVPGAVAADFSTDNTAKFVRDQDTGYLLLYTATNDKAWKSTDNGATWTATGAPGRVGGAGYRAGCVNAAQGYVVIADTNVGQTTVDVRVLTQSTGLWASTAVAASMTGGVGSQGPLGCNWSDTQQRWLIFGKGTQSWISDTTDPRGSWSQLSVGLVGAVPLLHGLVLDNVFCATKASGGTTLLYSLDYGETWRGSRVSPSGVDGRLEWDGARLWILANGVKLRTALRAPAASFYASYIASGF